MEPTTQLFQIFQAYAEQLPTFVAIVAGVILAVSRWKQHPRVAMVVVVALAFLFIHQIIFTIVYVVVPRWFINSAAGYEEMRKVIDRVLLVIGLISNGTAAIGFGILLAAIFMRRTTGPVAEN